MADSSSIPGRMPPRVRVAPSPTGDPHVGTAYIALFNYAFANKHGGKFVLRIEDTDAERSTKSSEAAIFEALRWTGLSWDEGPDVGGDHGPYRQSERADRYRAAADTLIERGHAYRCFCSQERLAEVRAKQEAAKSSHIGYDGHCRSLSEADAKARADGGEPYVVRLKVPRGPGQSAPGQPTSGGQGAPQTSFVDNLRGTITFSHDQVDDQILVKSDGNSTYHLANVVDDHAMEITHVIRGEDWLPSTPKHVLLYEAFGWEQPQWYHVGLLRNADKSKLSKRKNPVSINHYRDLGYLPATFLNFLATLGYSMPDERERFDLQTFVGAFDPARMNSGGPVFDAVKLAAFNADDIRAMSLDQLRAAIRERVLSDARIDALLGLSQERIETLDDFIPYASFFFGGSVDYGPVANKLRIKKRTPKESAKILAAWAEGIEKDPQARQFSVEGLEAFSRRFCEEQGWKPREVFTLLRIGATGRVAAPPLFDTLATLGKDRVRLRLRDAVAYLKGMPES